MLRSLVVALAIAGCSGSTPANDGGVKCTQQTYDPCNTEHDCTNMNCHPFPDLGATLCTQSCTPGDMTCPPYNGSNVACNSAGLCEPPAPNMCKIN